jgi:hypothetical protein
MWGASPLKIYHNNKLKPLFVDFPGGASPLKDYEHLSGFKKKRD